VYRKGGRSLGSQEIGRDNLGGRRKTGEHQVGAGSHNLRMQRLLDKKEKEEERLKRGTIRKRGIKNGGREDVVSYEKRRK